MKNAITDVAGLRVGHAGDARAMTGLTVIICPPGTAGGVDVRGSATATRGLDALNPHHLVGEINAILLTGGSAFGLDAAAGVMSYLEERGMGFRAGTSVVPTVAAAVIFDLSSGDPRVRPTPAMAYQACEAAGEGPPAEGSVGAGTGASVGKLFGRERAMKGGVGTASLAVPGGARVGALAVVNAFGDVLDWRSGELLAGLRDSPDGRELISTATQLRAGRGRARFAERATTLGVVATDVDLGKGELHKLAQMATNGLVRGLSPAFSTFDGDVVFSLCCGERKADLNILGLLAEEVLAEAIRRAVTEAESLGGLPAWRDLRDG